MAETELARLLAAIDATPIAILAWVGPDGRPRACPVTPYLADGDLVITTTFAYLAKVRAIRADPRIAVVVPGFEVRGDATLHRPTGSELDALLRQEVRKFPPTASLSAVPGHRCLFPWYFERVAIHLPLGSSSVVPHAEDTSTVLVSVTGAGPTFTDHVAGAAAVELAHAEDERMTDLRQRARHGRLRAVDGHQGHELVVELVTGSLDPRPVRAAPHRAVDDVCQLVELRRRARAARPLERAPV